MSTTASPESQARLRRIVTAGARIAAAKVGMVRLLTLMGGAELLWLLYVSDSLWDLGGGWLIGLGVVLGLPILILGWIWMTLVEIRELPERLTALRGAMTQEQREDAPEKAGLKDLFRFARDLKGIVGVAYRASEVSGAVSGMLMLANPIFWMAYLIALGAVGFYLFLGLIGLIFI